MWELKFYRAFVDDFSRMMDDKDKKENFVKFQKEEIEKLKKLNNEIAH